MMRVPSRGPAQKAAVVLAAFFLCTVTLCADSAPAADAETLKTRAPVFLHGGAVWSAASSVPKKLFTTGQAVRSRGVSAHPSGILLFDSAASRLALKDTSGAELSSVTLDGAYAWLTENRVLVRSDLYDEKSGFEFALYGVSETLPLKLKKMWTARLDCFVSDLAFSQDGALYLAGGNGADSAHCVYKIDATGIITTPLRLPWQGFFLRVIASGSTIFVFGSGADKSTRPLKIWTGRTDSRVLTETNVEGLPEKSSTWFGYGFPFPSVYRSSGSIPPAGAVDSAKTSDNVVLPLARSDGSVSLVRISLTENGRAKAAGAPAAGVVAVAEQSGGCFLPVGTGEKGPPVFRYIAHDPLAAPGSFSIATYDGNRISFSPLPWQTGSGSMPVPLKRYACSTETTPGTVSSRNFSTVHFMVMADIGHEPQAPVRATTTLPSSETETRSIPPPSASRFGLIFSSAFRTDCSSIFYSSCDFDAIFSDAKAINSSTPMAGTCVLFRVRGATCTASISFCPTTSM